MPMFILAKLLAFLPFGNFLQGNSLKLILIAVAVVGALLFVWRWKEGIREDALSNFNQKRLEEILKQTQQEQARFKKIIEDRETLILQLLDERQKLEADYKKLADKVRDSKPEDDAPVAPVLRDTLKALRERDGGKAPAPTPVKPDTPPTDSGNGAIDAWRRLTGQKG